MPHERKKPRGRLRQRGGEQQERRNNRRQGRTYEKSIVQSERRTFLPCAKGCGLPSCALEPARAACRWSRVQEHALFRWRSIT